MTSNRSHNALTHGIYGREAVLPWEDLEEFARLHQPIREDLDPNGALEEAGVLEVAELIWRKRRLAVAFMLPVYKDPPSADLLEAAKGGIVGLADYLAKPVQELLGRLPRHRHPSARLRQVADRHRQARHRPIAAAGIVVRPQDERR